MLLTESPTAKIVEQANSAIIRARKQLPAELFPARHQLEMDGFAIAGSAAVRAALEPIDLSDILEAVRSAPADPYDPTASRHRLYSQVHRHHDGTLGLVPPFQDGPNLASYTTYFQASHFNRQFGNQNRRFPPFPKSVLESDALRNLVNVCFAVIPRWRLKGDGRNSVLVGVHGQRLKSDGRRAGVASPPHLHQDGEPFTFVVMLERENVTGGVSYVATADAAGQSPDDIDESRILARGTLMAPLDILAIDDERVTHHVSGVLGANGRPGSRSVLLIDFSEIELVRTPPPAND
jgi:hypothetical protein